MFDNIWNIFLNLTSFHEDQYFGSTKEVSNNYRMEWLQIIQTMKSFPGYKGDDIAEKMHNPRHQVMPFFLQQWSLPS